MGKYSQTHYTDILGIHETAKTNHETGEKSKGYGWTYRESDAKADKSMGGKNSNDSNYSSGSSGGSSSGSGGGGGSCCYVTTACLDAMNLPRDSLEMKAMKTLTKDHILRSFRGKRDYIAYQRKGPVIVQAIESREDSQSIWKGVYEKLKSVTTSVLSSNYEKAHQLYKELVLGLEKQFTA